MLLQGMGSPLDYEEAYHWLHGAVIGDKAMHQKAASLLSRLGGCPPCHRPCQAMHWSPGSPFDITRPMGLCRWALCILPVGEDQRALMGPKTS